MHLYLIGYMGSGKSYWGPKFAEALGRPFWDLDQIIATEAGQSIPEIFRSEGEESFRRLESKVLVGLAGLSATESGSGSREGLGSGLGSGLQRERGGVIACGGGTPCRPENWEVMELTGRAVWLRVDEGVLADRLAGTGDGRPVLPADGRDGEALRAHMAERSACYRRALYVWENPSELDFDRALRGVRELLGWGSEAGEERGQATR